MGKRKEKEITVDSVVHYLNDFIESTYVDQSIELSMEMEAKIYSVMEYLINRRDNGRN